jgi:hypothetical protein
VEKKELVTAPVCWPCACDLLHQPTTVTDLDVSMLKLGAAMARTDDHFDALATLRPL